MKRKLIRQGAGGYTIYLPKAWVDAHHAAGGEVNIELLEEGLLITAREQEVARKTAIALRDMEESTIRTLITNAYRAGYDEISLTYEVEEQFHILQQTISTRLLGFEITKHEGKSCLIENVTEPAPEQFETLLRKLIYSVSDLFDIVGRGIRGERVHAEEVEERIQRYDNFCRRILIKETIRRRNSEMLWTFLALVVHAQRELYMVSKTLPVKLRRESSLFLDDVRAVFDLVKKAYIERDTALLGEIHTSYHARFAKGVKLLQSSSGKEALFLHHLLAALRQFYQANSPLAGALV